MSSLKINGSWIVVVILFELVVVNVSLSCHHVQLFNYGVSESDKHLLLAYHNKLRQTIALGHVPNQPPAANMLELKWDDSLAKSAQTWAICGVRQHDPHRHTSQQLVGQNMASIWTSIFIDSQPDFWTDAINKWFIEHSRYSYGPYSHTSAGHYTQLAWAETATVGCAYAFYYDPSKGFTKNYVCNYGPSGNVIGQLPYQRGYPNCYHYGLTDSKFYGLCDKQQHFETSHRYHHHYFG